MPLSKAKQAEWMKEYRKRKLGITQADVIPKSFNPLLPAVQPGVQSNNPTIEDLRKLIKGIESGESRYNVIPKQCTISYVQPKAPLLDADGHIIPDYE